MTAKNSPGTLRVQPAVAFTSSCPSSRSVFRAISALILTASLLLTGCATSRSTATATSAPFGQPVTASVKHSAAQVTAQDLSPDPEFLSSEAASEAAEFIRLGRESMRDAAWFEATEYLDSAMTHLALLDAEEHLGPRQQAAAALWRDSVNTWLIEATSQSSRLGGAGDMSEYLDQEIEEVSFASLEELEALLPRLPDRNFEIPLPSPMPHAVLQAMRVFTGSGRDYFERWLQRKGRYESLILGKLEERGMPRDLIYLAMVESGFNPQAWSHASASGLWQFIAPTGRRYGLHDDWWEDPRRDPVRATDAALDYLEDLHAEFGEWHQTMAAYNCGEGRIRRQLRADPGMTYWDMGLPKETRYYVPKILAAMIIGRNPAVFGFNTVETALPPLRFDTATVMQTLPLKGIAEAVGVSEDSLKSLNPALRRWSTPPGRGRYTVYLPEGTRDLFFANYGDIDTVPKLAMLRHRVTRGQTLSGIAARYGVTLTDIRSANGLPAGKKLHTGQLLTIPTTDRYVPGTRIARTTVNVGPRRHTVRKGETLSGIATKYHVTVSSLRRANGLKLSSAIKAGKALKIPLSGRDPIVLASNESYYRVRSGDNLSVISSRFGNTVTGLKRLNDGLSEDLQPGQRIRVR